MLLTLGIIVIGLGGYSANQPVHQHEDISFMNYRERDLALKEYARLAQESKDVEKEKYLRLFFDALPRDFSTFFKMTHYSLDKKFGMGFKGNTYCSMTTFSYVYSHNPWGRFHLELKENCPLEEIPVLPISGKFPDVPGCGSIISVSQLLEIQKVVPEQILYNKMLSLGVNGFWDADDVGFLSNCIAYLTFDNLPLAIEILSNPSFQKKEQDECLNLVNQPTKKTQNAPRESDRDLLFDR